MSKSLIKYSLFQNRKNFNPISLFKMNRDITYNEFVLFLEKKGVQAPSTAYFERVKSVFEDNNKVDIIEDNNKVDIINEDLQEEVNENVKVNAVDEVLKEVKISNDAINITAKSSKTSRSKKRVRSKAKKEIEIEEDNSD